MLYKITIVSIIILFLVIGAYLWQSSKHRYQDNIIDPKIIVIPKSKDQYLDEPNQIAEEYSDDSLKRIKASLNNISVSDTSERQITLQDGTVLPLSEYLQDVENDLYDAKLESAETKNFLKQMGQFIEAEENRSEQLSQETDDIIARGDTLIQKAESIRNKMNLIEPHLDRLHSSFGTEPTILPKPPANASTQERIEFYKNLQQKLR